MECKRGICKERCIDDTAHTATSRFSQNYQNGKGEELNWTSPFYTYVIRRGSKSETEIMESKLDSKHCFWYEVVTFYIVTFLKDTYSSSQRNTLDAGPRTPTIRFTQFTLKNSNQFYLFRLIYALSPFLSALFHRLHISIHRLCLWQSA